MELLEKTLLEWQELKEGQTELRIDRVLRINKAADYVLTIQVNDKKAWPVRRPYSEIAYAVASGNARVLEN